MEKIKGILKNKKALILIISALFLVLALSMSYAFFTGITNNDKKQEAKLNTGTMALTFRDGNNGVNAKLMLGESVTKKFIIENTGSLEASLSLDWDQLINTYMDGSLTYRLVRTENDVEVEEIIPKTNMPVSKEKLTQTLASELSVPSKKTYYYDLIITLNNLDVDQESDKEAVYNTHFNVGLPLQYRYYTLIVDPNGGTWKEFTTSQSYLLKNNETLKNITNPTRVGYTFGGWELKGTSSTYDSGTFTMGISDASLTAKWTAEKYTVTIDPAGGDYNGERELQVDYGDSVTLSEPTKTGYTFSHWETTGGTLSDNTLTITDPNNVTVTAKWTPNKYSYIVKHNKQNIDGNGYTTYETETIENIDYGTEVTPEYKSYDGFTQPTEKKTITIQEDNSLNVVEYNYDRIKYTLTVNPDGGTGGTTTQEVYYEGTINLTEPTKTGYDFQKWTVESGTGTLSDNTFKMGLGDTTIKANWKAQEYSLTFNPNGGAVTQGSKKITYGSTYGELPTATRDGYEFLGWFESQMGGNEVTSETSVDKEGNVTVYAGWKPNRYTLTFNLDGGNYDGTLPTEIDYDSTITLKVPTKTGYTFSGWSVSTGTIDGNNFTMNGISDVTLTATWDAISYNYKVIHRKMNVDGSTYTEVEEDTVSDSLPYGSPIPNDVKEYPGFASPNKIDKTIDVDSETPEKNVITYDYKRNQYTLSINTDGGVYSSDVSKKLYYEETTTLGTVTKTGHTFTNWSEPTIGTLSGNKYTMGVGDETLTANYTTNDYGYLVNHKKQNINDDGYTIYETETITEKVPFGSKVTPPVKDYGLGFNSPAPSELTIGEDTDPPTKNIKNYEYDRNIFKLTLDLDGGSITGGSSFDMKYESTKTLGTPTKTGYSFDKWIKTSGPENSTLTGSTFKMGTGVSTVKATYTINSYGYTVKHMKMNTDGSTYSQADTESKSGTYGTSATGTPKTTYTGFEAGTCNTITVGANASSNIVECKYPRKKYTLTINPNGGTYSGSTTVTDYYEKQITLGSLTKAGYTHSWSVTSGSGTVASNTFTFKASNATITANWSPGTYTVTLNANGGYFESTSVRTKTTTVTYNSTYGAGTLGSLPTPTSTQTGYTFLGWYTTSATSGGTEISNSTNVSITANQILYARWKCNTLLAIRSTSYSEKMWQHRTNITKIIFENTMSAPTNYIYSYDISKDSDSSVMAYLVTDTSDSSKYVAHIQADGKIYANQQSGWLFNAFTNLKSIEGLQYLDTSNVVYMWGMFRVCRSLTALDLSNFDTSKVTNMEEIFADCESLTSLDLSAFNTSKVTDMNNMFIGCSNLTSLNISSLNTSKVTDMNCMFSHCSSLTNLDLSHFDTSNVTNMSNMFDRCESLTNLNVSNFNTSKVTDMHGMFDVCQKLTSLNVSSFDTSNVTNMNCMFFFCQSLTSLDVSHFDTTNVTNLGDMFNYCQKLTSLDVSNFNTSNVTDMGSMFFACHRLTALDLSSFNTSKVTDMSSMFSSCNGLTSLDVSNFNTSNVINMNNMFWGCGGLTSLNLNNFNTAKVTNMEGMFYNCSKLQSLDLSNFDTSKVTLMGGPNSYDYGMFEKCSSLRTLNLQNWDVFSVTDNTNMFTEVSYYIRITVSTTTMRTWVINASDNPKLSTSKVVVA